MTDSLTLTHICVSSSTVKPSKPRCWMEGRLLEGSDVKLSCKSSDGSDPIQYKWERVLDKGKSVGKLPPLALIGESNTQTSRKPAYRTLLWTERGLYSYLRLTVSNNSLKCLSKICCHESHTLWQMHRLVFPQKCWLRQIKPVKVGSSDISPQYAW